VEGTVRDVDPSGFASQDRSGSLYCATPVPEAIPTPVPTPTPALAPSSDPTLPAEANDGLPSEPPDVSQLPEIQKQANAYQAKLLVNRMLPEMRI
jgi:hypothetical protein